jgi:hypothetical protein
MDQPVEAKRLNAFERYLSAWVTLCIVAGVAIGILAPRLIGAVSRLEVRHVNLPIALLIWLMIYPMMLRIDFAAIRGVGRRPKGVLVVLFVNWLVKPFSMAVLGWFFQAAFREPGGGDHPGRGPLHGHGVRVELPDRWGSSLHARPGGVERPHHAGRLCPDRYPAPRSLEHHSPV